MTGRFCPRPPSLKPSRLTRPSEPSRVGGGLRHADGGPHAADGAGRDDEGRTGLQTGGRREDLDFADEDDENLEGGGRGGRGGEAFKETRRHVCAPTHLPPTTPHSCDGFYSSFPDGW